MSVLNKGRDDNKNPQDNNQANTGNDVRINDEWAITDDQKTDSIFLLLARTVELDGVNYGPGEIKVAKEVATKLKSADNGVSEVKEDELHNQHHGAKPMPKDLNGVDYV